MLVEVTNTRAVLAQELSRSCLNALSGSLGAHNLLIGSVDRDFQALWEHLGAFLTASLRSKSLHSSKIWSSELSGSYFSGIVGSPHTHSGLQKLNDLIALAS